MWGGGGCAATITTITTSPPSPPSLVNFYALLSISTLHLQSPCSPCPLFSSPPLLSNVPPVTTSLGPSVSPLLTWRPFSVPQKSEMRKKEGRVRALSHALHVKLLPLRPSGGRSSFFPVLFFLKLSREEGSCLGAVGTVGRPQWLEIASLD